MMNLSTTKHPVKIIALLLSASLLFSCKKDKDNDNSSYPKDVTIEYRVTTTTSGLNAADVNYTNETGGMSSIDLAPIPFSKKITKRVNQYEVIGLSVTAIKNGNLKTEILVNDKLVKTETYTSTSVIHGTLAHQFE
ncbi:hypothetical protein D3H65_02235 [Paraflavitalea soli]|uniref:Uncharacterized protein n=1 Tax=Paraflavitalea soli TaxID=2315862 RepID=A0A3B7MEU0_9BACT|nr:hypothetical protein [Paraflavitalea soli]AXY72858.1 hypothetical protein D3H65_02235 [Paraflavitalea soli]